MLTLSANHATVGDAILGGGAYVALSLWLILRFPRRASIWRHERELARRMEKLDAALEQLGREAEARHQLAGYLNELAANYNELTRMQAERERLYGDLVVTTDPYVRAAIIAQYDQLNAASRDLMSRYL